MIRPYLPPPRHRRATVSRVARRPGRPPTPRVAERLSLARELVAHTPSISGAALAAELTELLQVSPPIVATEGRRLLAILRAAGDAPPPAGVAADGRRLSRPIRGRAERYSLRDATVERLAAVTGRQVGEDVDGQVGEVLDRIERADGAGKD